LVPRVHQWPEMAKIDFGRINSRPSRRQPSVQRLMRSAFWGVPCPMKIAGIRMLASLVMAVSRSDRLEL